MDIGHKIAELRNLHQFTQRELAGKLNLSQSAIAYYESNKKRPSLETLQLMAKIFDVKVSHFLDEQPPEEFRSIPGQKIENALADDPELLKFWGELSQREDLKILMRQVRDMQPKEVKRVIRLIKAVEDEEAAEDF